MMKRVGLPRFGLEVSRRLQQCRTSDVVDKDGVDEISEKGSKECLSVDSSQKGNLLTAIKKKLKRGTRRKNRCESRNACSENCEKVKHIRTRKGDSVWPVLRSHNHLEEGSEGVSVLTQELYKLSKYGWYWGPINRSEAESKLVDQPDGAFLVRDSSDDRYILSLSFRSYGKTLHTRIEHSGGLFSFYQQQEPEGHASVVELIQQSMCHSQQGAFCYSRSRAPGSPSFPVRLTKAVSRFNQVRSLQYLCRFVIRQSTRYDHIQRLPLPRRIRGYLEEGHY